MFQCNLLGRVASQTPTHARHQSTHALQRQWTVHLSVSDGPLPNTITSKLDQQEWILCFELVLLLFVCRLVLPQFSVVVGNGHINRKATVMAVIVEAAFLSALNKPNFHIQSKTPQIPCVVGIDCQA